MTRFEQIQAKDVCTGDIIKISPDETVEILRASVISKGRIRMTVSSFGEEAILIFPRNVFIEVSR